MLPIKTSLIAFIAACGIAAGAQSTDAQAAPSTGSQATTGHSQTRCYTVRERKPDGTVVTRRRCTTTATVRQ